MAIVIEGYVNIAGKRSNCEFPAYPGVPGRFYEVIMPDAFKMSLLQTTCIKLKVDHTRVIGSTHSGELQLADDSRGLWAHALISDPAVIAAARSGCIRGWSFAFIAEQSEWYRLDPREKLYYRKVKRAKLLEVSLMIEKRCGLFWNDRQRQKRRGGKAMELHEIERDIEALKSSPLVLVCRTPQGRVKAMSLQKCVETGSSFLYVAVDELDALLDQAINGTA